MVIRSLLFFAGLLVLFPLAAPERRAQGQQKAEKNAADYLPIIEKAAREIAKQHKGNEHVISYLRAWEQEMGDNNVAPKRPGIKKDPENGLFFDGVVQVGKKKHHFRLTGRRLKLPGNNGNFRALSEGWLMELSKTRGGHAAKAATAEVIWRHWVSNRGDPAHFPYGADICAGFSPREIYLIITFRSGFTIYKIDVDGKPLRLLPTCDEWSRLTSKDTGAIGYGPPFSDEFRKMYGPQVTHDHVKVRKATGKTKMLSVQCTVTPDESRLVTFTYDITKRKWLNDFKVKAQKKENQYIDVLFDGTVEVGKKKRHFRLTTRRLKFPDRARDGGRKKAMVWLVELAEKTKTKSSTETAAAKVIWRSWSPVESFPFDLPYNAGVCAGFARQEIYFVVRYGSKFVIYKAKADAKPRQLPRSLTEAYKPVKNNGAIADGPPFVAQLIKAYKLPPFSLLLFPVESLQMRTAGTKEKKLVITCNLHSKNPRRAPVMRFMYDITIKKWKWLKDIKIKAPKKEDQDLTALFGRTIQAAKKKNHSRRLKQAPRDSGKEQKAEKAFAHILLMASTLNKQRNEHAISYLRAYEQETGENNVAPKRPGIKKDPENGLFFDGIVQVGKKKHHFRLTGRPLKLPGTDGNFNWGTSNGWLIELSRKTEGEHGAKANGDKVIWRNWVCNFGSPAHFPYDADICGAFSPKEIYLIITFGRGFTIYKINVDGKPLRLLPTCDKWWKLSAKDTGAIACGPPSTGKLRKTYGPILRYEHLKIQRITGKAKQLSVQCSVTGYRFPVATFTYDINKRKWKWLEDFK